MKKEFLNPKKHVFLWDLHEVILKKTIWSWFITCIRFPRKMEVIRKLDKKTIIILLTFLCERLKLTKKQLVSEELLNAAQQAHNDALIELTIQACSSYTPIKKTVIIIEKLSQLGYQHYLGSNIGQTVFDDCVKKFPFIFNLFSGHIIPFVSPNTGKLIKKPQPEFFYAYIQKYKKNPNHIIFIDDKPTNIQAAQLLGIQTILFKDSISLQQSIAFFVPESNSAQ